MKIKEEGPRETGNSRANYPGWVVLSSILILIALAGRVTLCDTPDAAQSAGPASADHNQPPPATAIVTFEPVFVKGITFEGVSGRSVSTEELLNRRVSFFAETTAAGLLYHEARADTVKTEVRIGDIGKGEPTALDITALRAVATAASKVYQDRGIGAIRIDIMSDAVDRLRQKGSDGILVISVTEGQVAKVGTVARRLGQDKEGSDQADRNKPAHERIREKSPVQPGEPLNLPKVDDYVARLNRQPGRQVEAEVRPGQGPGEVELDYLIAEQKPWLVFSQLDNTGTKSTTELREWFGFRHYNLTGADDILALDYVTGNFQEVHYLLGSYDFPVPIWEMTRLKAFAGWSSYAGSELGIFDTEFTGQSYQIGAELRTTVFQRRQLFVDLLAGARYQHVQAENKLAGTDGESGFFIPCLGLEVDSRGKYMQGNAGLTLEVGVAGEDESELGLLGRSDVNGQWATFRYSLSGSTYLEPLLNPYYGGRQPVHEVYGAVRGQLTPGSQRLTPNFMYPAGGFYSVRGYPESIVSGDSSVVGTIEYRLHLLRLLQPHNQGEVSGWDLIVRAFADAGYVKYNDALAFEEATSLSSLGVGLDLKILHNIHCRIDLGVPLQDVNNGTEDVKSGEARVHFSVGASF